VVPLIHALCTSTGVGSPLLTSQDLADLFDPVHATSITPSSVQHLTATLSAGPVPGVLLLSITPIVAAPKLPCAIGSQPSLLHYCAGASPKSGIPQTQLWCLPIAGMAPAEAQSPAQQPTQQQQPPPQQPAPSLPENAQHPVMLPGTLAATSRPQMTAAQFLAGLPPQHQVQVLCMSPCIWPPHYLYVWHFTTEQLP
jgi:hypothetical protein